MLCQLCLPNEVLFQDAFLNGLPALCCKDDSNDIEYVYNCIVKFMQYMSVRSLMLAHDVTELTDIHTQSFYDVYMFIIIYLFEYFYYAMRICLSQ